MTDFVFNTPTKVVFGENSEAQLGALVKEQGAKKVLLHFGGGSVERSGLLDRVEASLGEAGVGFVRLGGVVPNPELALVRQGVALCRQEGVDFILAVGGGSVIDSAKAIAYGVPAACDVWDFFEGRASVEKALPVGCVLTIAAAGSEMSNSAVLTNAETHEKRGLGSELGRCRFAVMNPALTKTLPPYQTAAGVADILMHTLERYFTPEEDTLQITDEIAEGLLRTVMDNGRKLMRDPEDDKARAEVMWAGALSHNGLTGAGAGAGDWACHQLGHELSAKFGLTHGASLAAVWGSWARYVYKTRPGRFAQLAVNVLGVQPQKSDEATALAGIEEMEEYFWAIEMPTNLTEAEITLSDEDLEDMAVRCTFYGKRSIGGLKKLEKEDIAAIYRMAWEAGAEG